MVDKSPSTWRMFLNLLCAEAHPHGWARGLALGIILGILPKTNLLAVITAIALVGTRANLIAGLLATGLGSLVAYRLDPWFHLIGDNLLSIPFLQPVYARVLSLPVIAWMSLDNTVVAGSFFVGLLQLWPTQWLFRRLSRHRGASSKPDSDSPKESLENRPERGGRYVLHA